MLWMGEVEDAESIDDLIIGAIVKEKSILDQNLDSKIASGLMKILTGNKSPQPMEKSSI